jgi:hypothetical protein
MPDPIPASPNETQTSLKWQMFALSFTALFLEMMVIRWVPSIVQFVAYYANIMLLSSFLGLGVGAMAAERKWKLFRWFPVLLALEVVVLLLCENVSLAATTAEARFDAGNAVVLHTALIVGIFVVNALVFVPIGQKMGSLFNALPRLSAYGWDLTGSLCGTLAFGFFSLKYFSPVIGMAGVMVIFLLISPRRQWLVNLPIFAVILALMIATGHRGAIWSPYYYITVNRFDTPNVLETAPPPDLRTMRNPPAYVVKINHLMYHYDLSVNPARFTPEHQERVRRFQSKFNLPLLLSPARDRILIVGSGGGCDVETALLDDARHIDAVEIDPAIIELSRRFNAGAPYADARVTVHNDDARSFFTRAKTGYDLVIFGYLDSHALFSTMSNVRLDGYVYTVESLRSAYRLLNERGLLSLTFATPQPWLVPKLYRMVADATGKEPVLYLNKDDNSLALCVSKDAAFQPPASIGRYQRGAFDHRPTIDPPTDDWPFLYLSKKTIPSDYVMAIGALLALSVGAIVFLRGRTFGRSDVHFLLLGMAFLLLETKSISDCTLFFGATWFVTLVVVCGVLLMVMGSNLVAQRLKGFSFWMYVPLFAVLALLLFVPRESILGLSFAGRLGWTLFAVPLPVFFAGIIFSTTFRESAFPSAVFGANLVGAMLGGFCEYLRMAVGDHLLSLLIIAAYFGSFVALKRVK